MVSLYTVAQQYTIYVGFFLFVVGVFGNFMLILIFSVERNYRTTPCTFYFLIASIHDMFLLWFNLSLRVLSVGFSFNTSRGSMVWCKARYYLFTSWAVVTLTCQCLASIDQFLVTSKNARLRRLSTIKGAIKVTLCTIFIAYTNTLPWVIYGDVSSITKSCIYTNSNFIRYILVFAMFPLCIIPMVVMGLFGALAYTNILNTTALSQQNAHRQTTIMVCMQVSLVIFSGTFNAVWYGYLVVTYEMPRSIDLYAQEYLIDAMITLLPYLIISVCV
jgi:hypothetical protein